MARRVVQAVLTLAAAAAFADGARAGDLMFRQPPFVSAGRTYVPARQFCEWLGADYRWTRARDAVSVGWQGRRASLAVRRRGGVEYLRLRDFVEGFGGTLEWRSDARIVDFWWPARETQSAEKRYAAIPVGWQRPRLPGGLTAGQAAVWRALVMWSGRDDPRIAEPRDIRICRNWAAARLHPLNFVTDDWLALLEHTPEGWSIIAHGTDLYPRNWGVPVPVRRCLGLGW